MEIDVDDILQYADDDDLIPHDNFGDVQEEGNRRNRRGSPPPRRNTYVNENANKIVSMDGSMLDPALDWYLRIDLDNEQANLDKKQERDRRLDQEIQRIELARQATGCSVEFSHSNIDVEEEGIGEINESTRHGYVENDYRLLDYPPIEAPNWLPITTPGDNSRYYITLKPMDGDRSNRADITTTTRERPLGQDFEKLLEKAQKLIESKTMLETTSMAESMSTNDEETQYDQY